MDSPTQILALIHQHLVRIQQLFNYLLDYYADNTAVITNLVDGLLENDSYGNLVPALAEDWSVSADGLTYTYKLRKDAKWYTADGEEYASVKAQDLSLGSNMPRTTRGKPWI